MLAVDRLTIGEKPLELFLDGLLAGYGWYNGVRTEDGSDWPAGIGADFTFTLGDGTKTVWTASVTADRIVWDMSEADVAAVLAADVARIDLAYVTSDGRRVPWGRGRL